MGAEPYQYVVPYQPDIQAALDDLREQVFDAGTYEGAELEPANMFEAFENAEESGTASILDILQIGDAPDFRIASRLPDAELTKLFGTKKPTRAMVEHSDGFWEQIERGMARYVILYEGDTPKQIFFGGYSFD